MLWAGELAPPAGGFFEAHGEALQPAKAMLRTVRPIVRGVARMEGAPRLEDSRRRGGG